MWNLHESRIYRINTVSLNQSLKGAVALLFVCTTVLYLNSKTK